MSAIFSLVELKSIRNSLIGKKCHASQFPQLADVWSHALREKDVEIMKCCLDIASLLTEFSCDVDLIRETLDYPQLQEALLRVLKRNPTTPIPQELFQIKGYDSLLCQIIVTHAQHVQQANDMVGMGALKVVSRVPGQQGYQAAISLIKDNPIAAKHWLDLSALPVLTNGDVEDRLTAGLLITLLHRTDVIPNFPVKEQLLPCLCSCYNQLKDKHSIDTLNLLLTDPSVPIGTLESWQTKAGDLGLVASLCSSLDQCKPVVKVETTSDVMDATQISQLTTLSGVGGWALRKKIASSPKKHSTTDSLLLPLLQLLSNLLSHSTSTRAIVLNKTSTLEALVKWLKDDDLEIRGASCSVLRSLSRSVKGLRTGLWDSGVGPALLDLVVDCYDDSSMEDTTNILITATAAICNIVLDFSPMKSSVTQHSRVLDILTESTKSSNVALRLNSMWALKNMLYQSDHATKQKIMNHLGWDYLLDLCNFESDSAVREQAVAAIRNLACDSDISTILAREKQIVDMVKDALMHGSDQVAFQALYVIVNLATGNVQHKDLIMRDVDLLEIIRDYMMHHRLPSHRLGTMWVLINLTWPDDLGSAGRLQTLKQLNFEDELQPLLTDIDSDVRERARLVMNNFQGRSRGTTPVDVPDDTASDAPHSISSYIDFVRRFAPSGQSRRGNI